MSAIIKFLQEIQEFDPFISEAIILSAAMLLAIIFAGNQFRFTVSFKRIKLIFVYLGLKKKIIIKLKSFAIMPIPDLIVAKNAESIFF